MKITRDDLIEWIDRSPSNSDLEMCKYIIGLQESRLKAIEYIDNAPTLDYGTTMEFNIKEFPFVQHILEILGGKE